MKSRITFAILFSFSFSLSGVTYGAITCPERIKYLGGNHLKNAERYYFRNGNTFINGDHIYYPSGNSFRNGDTLYYPNGNSLKRTERIYYPNGNTLRNGERYYYGNGNTMGNGETFYYSNGTTARRNGKLYRPDGSETPFPVRLSETIGEFGSLSVELGSTTQTITIYFRNLFSGSEEVSLRGFTEAGSSSQLDFTIRTGVSGEDVSVVVANGQISCTLADPNPPEVFTVIGNAGKAQVSVNFGYDAAKIRSAVEQALQ